MVKKQMSKPGAAKRSSKKSGTKPAPKRVPWRLAEARGALDELGDLSKRDYDRLVALIAIAADDGDRGRAMVVRADAWAALWPGVDDSKADKNLRALMSRVARKSGAVGLRLVSDQQRGQKVIAFHGPDRVIERIEQYSREASQLPEEIELIDNPALPGDTRTRGAPRIPVTLALLHTQKDARLFHSLYKDRLETQFDTSKTYNYNAWHRDRVLAGEVPTEVVEREVRRADLVLLFVSPPFFASPADRANWALVKQHNRLVVPIVLRDVDPAYNDLDGAEHYQLFRFDEKSWQGCPAPKREQFVLALFRQIELRLGRHFAGAGTTTHAFRKLLVDVLACDGTDGDKLRQLERLADDPRAEAEHVLACFPHDQGRSVVRNLLQRAKRRGPGLEEMARRSVAQMGRLDPEQLEDSLAAYADLASDVPTPRSEPQSALEMLTQWACDAKTTQRYACVLGEFGIGKTVTLQRLTRHLLELRKAGRPGVPLPIYVDLRTYVEATGGRGVPVFNRDELLDEMLKRVYKHESETRVTAREVVQAVRTQGALILFDGLDEKMVGMREVQGQAFVRALWSVLPPRSEAAREATSTTHAKKPRGKLLFSCRSHLFPTLRDQNATFCGNERDDVKATDYLALILLPFSGEQIRSYLTKCLGAEKVEGALRLIGDVHNLQELAQRPFFLKLIQGQVTTLEQRRARGEDVRGVTLYDDLLAASFQRDKAKHRFRDTDKSRLMEDVAAAMWSAGQREWPWDELSRWFTTRVNTDPTMADYFKGQTKPGESMEILAEDFRTATMVIRPDDRADAFRFAHTSLQEYFLARYLYRTLLAGDLSAWAMPMPSRETLDFFGQLLAVRTHGGAWQTPLEQLLAEHRPQATRVAFAYWLVAVANGHPQPQPGHVDLRGENFDEWLIAGANGQALNLRGADLRGVMLARAQLKQVDLSGADLGGADLTAAELQDVRAVGVKLKKCTCNGSTWRDCELDVAEGGATWKGVHWIRGTRRGEGCPPPPPPDSPQNHEGGAPIGAGSVNAGGYSSGGTRIVSGSDDKTVRVWDAASGRLLLSLQGHLGSVLACAFSPNGTRIVSGSSDQTVRVWDADSGRLLLSLQGHSGSVFACGYSPDGGRIVSGSDDHTVRVWDAESGNLLLALEGHSGSVFACGYSPDGTHIVSGSYDESVRVWSAESGVLLLPLIGHSASVQACGHSPCGTRIVSASSDEIVRVWDAESGQVLLSLQGHSGPVNACGYSPDGKRILFGSGDHLVRVWDAESGRSLLSLYGHSLPVNACGYNSAGTRIVSGSDDKTVRVWDAESGRLLLSLQSHSAGVRACGYSPGGTRIVSGSDDHTVRVWDAESGRLLHSLQGHSAWVQACGYSPDGRRIVSGSYDHKVRVWAAESGRLLLCLQGHSTFVQACGYSPDGTRIVSASNDRTVRVWDAESGRFLLSLQGHSAWVLACGYSPDGTRIVSASADHTVRVWDAESGRLLHSLEGHSRAVRACEYSPDGMRIVSASSDATVRVWDAESGHLIFILQGHSAWVRACGYSPDGTRIVSASNDQTVRVWDANSGRLVLTLQGHSRPVLACEYSPDGTRIVSASDDNTMRVWDANSGAPLKVYYHGPEQSTACLDVVKNRITAASANAWRYFGWRAWDAEDQTYRVYPAEAFGRLPE